MNNEDKFQRQMEFILNQQAQFAADIGQLKDLHNQQSQIVTRLNDVVTRLATVTLEGFKTIESKMAALVDAQIRTEENVSILSERMTTLTEAQAHTDDRLNALINVVERHISEGHNGGPQR